MRAEQIQAPAVVQALPEHQQHIGVPPVQGAERLIPTDSNVVLLGEIPYVDSDSVPQSLQARVGALEQLHKANRSVQYIIRRRERNGELEYMIGGVGHSLPEDRTGSVVTDVPLAGKGAVVDNETLVASLDNDEAGQKWVVVRGEVPELPRELLQTHLGGDTGKIPLEIGLLASYHEPFTLVVNAEPISPEEANRLQEQTGEQLSEARATKRVVESDMQASGLTTQYEVGAVGQVTGLWKTTVVIGANTEYDAQRAAGGFAVATQSPAEPTLYQVDGETHTTLAKALGGREDLASWVATTRDVANIIEPPLEEQPGLRIFHWPAELAANGPKLENVDPERVISLGRIMVNGFEATDLELPIDVILKHVLVVAATGGGKSKTVQTLLEKLAEKGISFTALEMAKAEYKVMGDILGQNPDVPEHLRSVTRFRPGEVQQAPVSINFLEPVAQAALPEHIENVMTIIQNAFYEGGPEDKSGNEELFRGILENIFLGGEVVIDGKSIGRLTGIFHDYGFDPETGFHPDGNRAVYPQIVDMRNKAIQVLNMMGYAGEIEKNVKTFVTRRLGNLMVGLQGRFLDGQYPIDTGMMLSNNSVLEFEGISSKQRRSLMVGSVIAKLYSQIKAQHAEGKIEKTPHLKHVFVIPEAKGLLTSDSDATNRLADMIAEIRAYGYGFIFETQGDLQQTNKQALANTSTTLLGTNSGGDVEILTRKLRATEEQAAFSSTLEPGQMLTYIPGMGLRPLIFQAPPVEGRPSRLDQTKPATELVSGQVEFFNLDEIKAAEELLRTQAGRTLQGLVEFNVLTKTMQMGEVAPNLAGNPDFEKLLAETIDPVTGVNSRRVVACAINEAVRASVIGRVTQELAEGVRLTQRVGFQELTQHISERVQDLLFNGATPQGPSAEYAHPLLAPISAMGPIVQVIYEALGRNPHMNQNTIPPHPATAEIAQSIGRETIEGGSAVAQLTALRKTAGNPERVLFADNKRLGTIMSDVVDASADQVIGQQIKIAQEAAPVRKAFEEARVAHNAAFVGAVERIKSQGWLTDEQADLLATNTPDVIDAMRIAAGAPPHNKDAADTAAQAVKDAVKEAIIERELDTLTNHEYIILTHDDPNVAAARAEVAARQFASQQVDDQIEAVKGGWLRKLEERMKSYTFLRPEDKAAINYAYSAHLDAIKARTFAAQGIK